MNGKPESKLYLRGDLTIYCAAELRDTLVSCLLEEKTVDISGTGTVDSCAMQLFIAAKKSAALRGKKFRIVGHTPEFIKMLDLYGLIRQFGDPVRVPASLKNELLLSYSLSADGGKS